MRVRKIGVYAMIRTVLWFIYFWLYLIAVLPFFARAVWLDKKGRIKELDELVSWIVQAWARALLRAAGADVTVIGEDNIPDGAAVFVSNHQGNFDVPIMLGLVGKPRGLIAKKELLKLPMIRSWMRYLHCIFVDRNDPKEAVKSLMEGIALVQKGYSMTIFPEGTRSKGGDMNALKGGAFRIATKACVPVIPVTINGSYKLMEANKGFMISPAKVCVTVHEPIKTENMDKEAIKELPEKVKQVIASAL